jgi:hypothetical protein
VLIETYVLPFSQSDEVIFTLLPLCMTSEDVPTDGQFTALVLWLCARNRLKILRELLARFQLSSVTLQDKSAVEAVRGVANLAVLHVLRTGSGVVPDLKALERLLARWCDKFPNATTNG